MRRLSIEFSLGFTLVNDNTPTISMGKLERSQRSVFACMCMYASLGFKDAKKLYAKLTSSFVLKVLLICL